MEKRHLVAFEGMDGTGKSTLSKLVAERIGAHWMPFPSHDGEIGKLIRRTFAGEIKLSTQSLAYLMVADGLDYVPIIEERLKTTPVVCDRHTVVSGWAYQPEVYPIDMLLALQQRTQFRRPDVTFILDVPEEVAMQRLKDRGGVKNPIYEREDGAYVSRIRHRYLAYHFMHPDNTLLLDGTLSLEELSDLALSVLNTLDNPSPED